MYTINQYTVTYETYGGRYVESVKADYLTTIVKEPSTKLASHKFFGWYYDEEFTEQVEYPLTITKDMTVYAKWIKASDTNNKYKK